MILKKSQLPILALVVIAVIIFGSQFIQTQNQEFIIYIAVIVFFIALILTTNKKVQYTDGLLWGLAIWAVLHMAGGSIYLGETRLYELILIPLSNEYPIIRYDQAIHTYGFFIATLVVFHVLKPILKKELKTWGAVSFVVVMAGFGLGALNEVVEFIATLIAPQTGVGGYLNISLDLVSNLIGAILAMIVIRMKQQYPTSK